MHGPIVVAVHAAPPYLGGLATLRRAMGADLPGTRELEAELALERVVDLAVDVGPGVRVEGDLGDEVVLLPRPRP